MVTRRRVLAVASTLAVAGCTSESDDETTAPERAATDASETDAPTETTGTVEEPLAFSSTAFKDGGTIPERYTGVGEDVSPPLTIESVPDAAETLVLVLDDPDANNYVHWVIWNIPADIESIPEEIPQQKTVPSLDGARQGTNNFGELGYRGPLPPADDGAHTYQFTMFAVDTTLDLEAGAGRGKLNDALDGHVVDKAQITGEFDR